MKTPKDTSYFPHDSNASNDPKIMLLISQLGLDAYGAYWILIEYLRQQPEYRAPLNLLDPLSRRYGYSKEKFDVIVKNYGLFAYDEQYFYSVSLVNRMKILEIKREQQRQKALKRWSGNATAIPEQCHGNATAMQEKNRIEKNRIEKNSIEKRYESFSLSVHHFSNIYPLEMLKAFFDYWTEKNKSGTKMRFELEKTFEISKRLATWASREKDFNSQKLSDRPIIY